MRTLHYNGEYWYERTDGVAMRILDWLVWSGPVYAFLRRSPGAPRSLRDAIADPTPVSLFGHRVTFQWFGVDVRTPWGFLCVHRDRDGRRYAYVSRDATPQGARLWLHGAPSHIERIVRRSGETVEAWRGRLGADERYS